MFIISEISCHQGICRNRSLGCYMFLPEFRANCNNTFILRTNGSCVKPYDDNMLSSSFAVLSINSLFLQLLFEYYIFRLPFPKHNYIMVAWLKY